MGSEGLDKFGSWSGGGRVLCAVRVSGCTVMGLKNLLAQEAPQGVLGPGFLGLGRATLKVAPPGRSTSSRFLGGAHGALRGGAGQTPG